MADAAAAQQMSEPLSSEAPALTWLSVIESWERLESGSLPAAGTSKVCACQGPAWGQNRLLCRESRSVWYQLAAALSCVSKMKSLKQHIRSIEAKRICKNDVHQLLRSSTMLNISWWLEHRAHKGECLVFLVVSGRGMPFYAMQITGLHCICGDIA